MATESKAKDKSTVKKWPKILLLGDSQTQEGYGVEGCWVSILSNHFQRRCDVINRGFTGYNARWVKEMLPQVVDAELVRECAAVTLFLGSNDANLPEFNPEHHVPLDEYKESLIYIIQYVMDLGANREKIILIAPPPVDEDQWTKSLVADGRPAEHGLRNSVIAKYAEACCQAATELNVDCVDLYTKMMEYEDWTKFVNVDGLHLASQGGQLLSNLIIPKLEKITTPCTTLFPHFTEIDNDNPSHSF